MGGMEQTLAGILAAAAAGRFPADDGGVTVVAQPSPRDAGVVAFTAHSVVFLDEDPGWVRKTLATVDCDSLAAAMNPRFLAALLERTGRRTDTIDLLTVAAPLDGPPPIDLREITDQEHPRVRRARVRRDDIRVWVIDDGSGAAGAKAIRNSDASTAETTRNSDASTAAATRSADASTAEATRSAGLLVLGRGVAGRWEAAIEVEPEARHRGLGKALAVAARHLVPDGEPVWAQQAAGNARSIRAFQAAGYRPIGAESLMIPQPG